MGLLPRWMAALSYLSAAFLLVSTTFHPAILLVLPAWVLLFSVVVLAGAGRRTPLADRAPGRTRTGCGGPERGSDHLPAHRAPNPDPAQED